MKDSRTSPLYSSRQVVELLNCLLDLESDCQKKYIEYEKYYLI